MGYRQNFELICCKIIEKDKILQFLVHFLSLNGIQINRSPLNKGFQTSSLNSSKIISSF